MGPWFHLHQRVRLEAQSAMSGHAMPYRSRQMRIFQSGIFPPRIPAAYVEGLRSKSGILVYVHVSRLLADVLDPVLTASVFTAGQTGLHPDDESQKSGSYEAPWPDQSGSIVWCAPYQEVQQRYPSLPQAHGEGLGRDYVCIDLTVTITGGRITEIDLEGFSLAETFFALGRHAEAQSAGRLLGESAEAGSGPLRELLALLLEPSVD